VPTGYTSDLYNGKPQSFSEFVMNCARAFGALIELRDEPNAPIPDEFQPSDYYPKQLAQAQQRLKELKGMSLADAQRASDAAFEAELSRWHERAADRRATRLRYEEMLDQVDAWQAPTSEHEGLKKFMHDQLAESIDFDCSRIMPAPVHEPAAEWLARELGRAEHDVEYYTAELEKERQRQAERSRWVRDLRSSLLPAVEPAS
jgi:hypothetical protein